ncbi:translation initiation factor IF-2-like [Penaeus monodon]|uniref:translation initiation factor IF-2-like n=1 Tax=Penaeus monodon TaxID=6687 RepID=UPI0018A74333|nr:translation initiation factor IF-2-like [Penaeus monodon]
MLLSISAWAYEVRDQHERGIAHASWSVHDRDANYQANRYRQSKQPIPGTDSQHTQRLHSQPAQHNHFCVLFAEPPNLRPPSRPPQPPPHRRPSPRPSSRPPPEPFLSPPLSAPKCTAASSIGLGRVPPRPRHLDVTQVSLTSEDLLAERRPRNPTALTPPHNRGQSALARSPAPYAPQPTRQAGFLFWLSARGRE